MDRLCSKCKDSLPEEEFHWKDKAAGVRKSRCRKCTNCDFRERWKGDRHKTPPSIRNKRRKALLHRQKHDYLSKQSCMDCGESDPLVLDFDHLEPSTKSCGISRMITDGQTWDRILVEIRKCVVRCANCHRRRTARQFGWYGV